MELIFREAELFLQAEDIPVEVLGWIRDEQTIISPRSLRASATRRAVITQSGATLTVERLDHSRTQPPPDELLGGEPAQRPQDVLVSSRPNAAARSASSTHRRFASVRLAVVWI